MKGLFLKFSICLLMTGMLVTCTGHPLLRENTKELEQTELEDPLTRSEEEDRRRPGMARSKSQDCGQDLLSHFVLSHLSLRHHLLNLYSRNRCVRCSSYSAWEERNGVGAFLLL